MKHLVPLLAAVVFAVVPGCAESFLPLQNASFEIQNPFDQSAGCNPGTTCYNYSIIAWDIHSGAAGTFNPSLSPGLPKALSGNNVAFLQGGYISQDLGFLNASTQYAVTVAVAGRDSNTPAYRLGDSLGSSASPTFTNFFEIAGIAPASAWAIATLHFTPTASGNYFVYVANDGPGQLLVDAVPEPSSFALLALGGAALALLRRNARSAG